MLMQGETVGTALGASKFRLRQALRLWLGLSTITVASCGGTIQRGCQITFITKKIVCFWVTTYKIYVICQTAVISATKKEKLGVGRYHQQDRLPKSSFTLHRAHLGWFPQTNPQYVRLEGPLHLGNVRLDLFGIRSKLSPVYLHIL